MSLLDLGDFLLFWHGTHTNTPLVHLCVVPYEILMLGHELDRMLAIGTVSTKCIELKPNDSSTDLIIIEIMVECISISKRQQIEIWHESKVIAIVP